MENIMIDQRNGILKSHCFDCPQIITIVQFYELIKGKFFI